MRGLSAESAPAADSGERLALDLGQRVAAASRLGLPSDQVCDAVVDVALAACRAAGMGRATALALFRERARRRVAAVSDAVGTRS